MDALDEKIHDPALDHTEEQEEQVVEQLQGGERDEQQAEDELGVEQAVQAVGKFEQVLGLVEAILHGEEIDAATFDTLSDAEKTAFEVLQEVVAGKGKDEQMLFAEER